MRRWSAFLALIFAAGCGDVRLDVGNDATNRYATPETILAEANAGPGVATVIASRQIDVRSIAVDDNRLYWALDGGGNPMSPDEAFRERGVIRSCEPDNCADTVITHATEQHEVMLIGVAGGRIFWSGRREQSTFGIYACAVESCSASTELLAPVLRWSEVATDGTHMFWLSGGSDLFRCSIADCSKTLVTLANTRSPSASGAIPLDIGSLALSATDVYWIDTNQSKSIMTIPKDGSRPARAFVTDLHRPLGLTVTEPYVAWIEHYSLGQVLSCPLSDCSSGPRVLSSQQPYVHLLAAEGEGLYWFGRRGRPWGDQFDESPADLFECGREGCVDRGASPLTVERKWPLQTAVNRTHLYWISGAPMGDLPFEDPYDGTVKRIRRTR